MSRTSVLAEKILVADDDRATRFAVCSMLKKAGYAVTAVKDGSQALRNIQRTSFCSGISGHLDAKADRP
jgi:CheY-like chemotaxis protein